MIRSWRPACAPAALLVIIHALVACAPLLPAGDPPPSPNAPGAFVVVTEGRLDAGHFRLEFPPTWTLVKASPADVARLHLAFVAPDGGLVSLIQLASVEAPGDNQIQLENGVVLTVSVEPAADPSPNFLTQAEQLIASISS
ncbi:MAG: hypothetical protein OXI34_15670 [Chloroflexota bacterium]|nr:hypothetical protein [Chloroflexota bacterium]